MTGYSVSAQQVDLAPRYEPDTLVEVTTAIEVSGELQSKAEGSKVVRTPFQVIGHLNYHEKFLAIDDELLPTRAARHYKKATADIHVGRTKVSPELPAERSTLAAHFDQDGNVVLFSPTGQLTREQLDLIDAQANSLTMGGLLPVKPVAIGDEWKPLPKRLAQVLDVDAIAKSDVTCRLKRIESGVAIIYMSGKVEGAVRGVNTEIEIDAKYNVDVERRLLTWLTMSLKEDRAIGHAEPGLEVTARIRVQIKPLTVSEPLAEALASGMSFKPEIGSELLDFNSKPGGFAVMHDRRWQVMVDREDVTVWRFVDRGELVAQANFSRLTDLPAEKKLEPTAFQTNVRQALGDSFRRFVSVTDEMENELRILRVIAQGTSSDLPITWIYYHVSDRKGRRLAIVFTLESSLIEQFAEGDLSLVSSIRLEDLPEPKTARKIE